jgi:KTSC domain
MADEPQNTFQTRVGEVAADAAAAAGAALAAIASGFAIRARELLDLADEFGHIEVPVQSTCIHQLRWDRVTGTMGVTFNDGSEYDVPDVSLFAFLAFVNAPSKGRHWNDHFRDKSATQWAGSTKQKRKIGRRR